MHYDIYNFFVFKKEKVGINFAAHH